MTEAASRADAVQQWHRPRIAKLVVTLALSLIGAWGIVVYWGDDQKYPEVPFRGFIASSSGISATVAGLAHVILREHELMVTAIVAVGWGSLYLGLGIVALPQVGGWALIGAALLVVPVAVSVLVWARNTNSSMQP